MLSKLVYYGLSASYNSRNQSINVFIQSHFFLRMGQQSFVLALPTLRRCNGMIRVRREGYQFVHVAFFSCSDCSEVELLTEFLDWGLGNHW